MVHTAKRLLPFAVNKVIHIEAIHDPAFIRLLRNTRTLSFIREGLKSIDSQYEVLVPYKVDDEERQLKRFIQWKLGTTVNLSTLRRKHQKYYLKLYAYGSPAHVIRRWGLSVEYDDVRTEEALLEAVQGFTSDGAVSGISSDSKLYRSLRYYASKSGKSIAGYLKSHNLNYIGRNDEQ
jgi:hypothetical protein